MTTLRKLAAVVVAILLLLVVVQPSHADLRRLPRSWLFGPTAVWTNGTSTPMFFPLSDVMESAGLTDIRVSTEMRQDSGNCEIRPALRYSDDGITWDASDDLGIAYLTSVGIDPGTTYTDITALGSTVRSYLQFGVQVANDSGALIEVCNATLRVEPKQMVR